MSKPTILIIKTGGTPAQKPNAKGYLEPSSEEYLHLVSGLEDIVDFEVKNLENIDSTDMETNFKSEQQKAKDRADIARVVYDNAFKYDGFVVIHGTDTMAETAAALTYMIQDLKKPIVLTGSQRSIWGHRSDAPNNIYTAVQAATMDLGEVVILFGNYLLRGSRARKIDEDGYDAFSRPDMRPLGKVTPLNIGIHISEHRIPRGEGNPIIFTDFDTRVFHYSHVSGTTVDEDLMYIARSECNHGILLGGFGAGNIPKRLLCFIKEARSNGKPVLVYTRCEIGAADMKIYSVGAAALEAGATSAGDMTLEAIGQKLMYALGRAKSENLSSEEKLRFVELIIKKPYNGDITVGDGRR